MLVHIYFAERRAHVPLGAGARVTHGVGVVITENHLNETAPSGCVARLVRFVFIGILMTLPVHLQE